MKNETTAQKIERLETKAEKIKNELESLKKNQALEGYRVAFSEILQTARDYSEFISAEIEREPHTGFSRWRITMFEPTAV